MIRKTERIKIMGSPVDNLSFRQTITAIDTIIKKGIPQQHVVINAGKILQIRKDRTLYDIINSCAIINPDGMPVVWASWLLGKPLKERISGIDLMFKLMEHSLKKKYRIYLLGAREEIIQKVVGICQEKYKGIRIAGYRNGYWKEKEEKKVVENIKKSRADILFVAMSSPKKEIFLNKYLKELNVPFNMGVGGSFDVLGGAIKRAPLWMQLIGLEWFFRLIQEPGRMWKRYLIGNSLFIWLLIKEFVRNRILRQGD